MERRLKSRVYVSVHVRYKPHPSQFLINFAVVTPRYDYGQVTGIYFESKVDYTTWFGDNVEYIHGIQVMASNQDPDSVELPPRE